MDLSLSSPSVSILLHPAVIHPHHHFRINGAKEEVKEVILLTHLFHLIRQNIIWSLTTSFFSLPLLSEHCCKSGSKISLYSRYDQQNLLFFCCLYVVHLFLSPMKTSLESCQLSSIKHFLIRCLFVTFLE